MIEAAPPSSSAVAGPSNPAAALSPYELRHLVSHMKDAGLNDDVHSLLRLDWVVSHDEGGPRRHNAWFELKESADERAGFVTDVETAWEVADTMAEHPDDEGADRAIGLGLRYALIHASLSSRAANIPAGLLLTLTRRSVWTPGTAIASALQLGEVHETVEALTGLANVFVPQGRAEELMVAAETLDEPDHALVLSAVAAVATPALFEQVMLAAESIRDEAIRVEVLTAVARAPGGPVESVLRAAATLESDKARADVLAACAHAATAEQLAGMTAAAGRMRVGPRIDLLTALAPIIPEAEVERALAMVDRLRPAPARSALAADLARRLQEPARSAWFDRQAKTASKLPAAERALLCGALGDGTAARKAAGSIRELKKRVEVQSQLAQYLDPTEMEDVLALLGRSRLVTPHEAGRAIVALAPHLPVRLLPKASKVARAIDHSHPRADALAALAPHLPARSTGPVLKSALALKDVDRRGRVLRALAPNLPPAALDRTLASIGKARAAGTRPRLLASIVDYLSEAQVRKAFRWSMRIGSIGDRTRTIGILAPHLPNELLDDAVAALEGVGDREAAAEALAHLAPHGPSNLVPRALAAVTSVRRPKHSPSILEPLAGLLTESGLLQALDWSRQASDWSVLVEALAAIGPRLVARGHADLVAEKLDLLPDLTTARFLELRRLIDLLPPQWSNAFLDARRASLAASAQEIMADDGQAFRFPPIPMAGESPESDLWRDWWLFHLDWFHRDDRRADLAVEMASVGMHEEAAELVESIRAREWRVEALAGMVPLMPARDRSPLVHEIVEALRDAGSWQVGPEHYSPDAVRVGLAAVGDLGPYLDPPSVATFLDALAAIEALWPSDGDRGWDVSRKSLCQAEAGLARLADHETCRAVVTRGLARFDSMIDERMSELAAAALATCLDRGTVEPWLERVQGKLSSLRRADAYRALAIRLHELGDVGRAFEIAVGIDSPEPRRRALHVVGPSLAAFGRQELWPTWTGSGDESGVVRRLATRSRPMLLADIAALAPAIAAVGGQRAITETFEAILDVTEWWP
jgi:hypothetical protein